MSKKDNEKRIQARELYEESGFSLADIARKLNISAGTVRGWKSKDKQNGNAWSVPKAGKRSKKRSVPEASLANLDANRHPPIQPGEKLALKHGFYADNSNESSYDRYYKQAMEEPINQTSKELFARNYANTMVAMEKVNPNNSAHIEAMARTGVMVTNMAEKASKIEMNELNIEEKRQHMSGNDPALELVKEYTEAFRDYANAHEKTD